MKNNNLKLYLVILLAFFISVLIILIIMNRREGTSDKNIDTVNSVNNEIPNNEEIDNGGDFITSEEYSEVTSPTSFYTVKNYVEEFFYHIESLSNSNSSIEELMGILYDDYIIENNITSDNLNNKLSKLIKYSFNIDNIYVYSNTNTLTTFLVNGNFTNEVDGFTSYNIFMAIDYESGAYKIYPAGNNSKFVNNKNIELNEYNKYKNNTVDDLTMCNNYLNFYKQKIQENLSEAYDLLDNDYKKVRFKNVDSYIQYVNNNKNNILNFKVEKYKVNVNTDGSKQYIIIDNNSYYFIINARSVMNFSIMLDSYTTPLSETTTKYSSASDQEKACMCLEMVKEMINNKDYETIYSHLNETFKSNNFSSFENFSNLIKSKYYDINTFSYESYSTANDSYIINVKVSDNSDKNKNFDMSFVVKLGKSINDFEMSFNI